MLKQVIVLRTDLKMQRGKEIAQGAHVSGKIIANNLHDPRVQEWLGGSYAKIAVGVPSEEELLDLIERAREKGILVEHVIDEGRTQFKGQKTLTAAAFGPDDADLIDTLTKDLKLR